MLACICQFNCNGMKISGLFLLRWQQHYPCEEGLPWCLSKQKMSITSVPCFSYPRNSALLAKQHKDVRANAMLDNSPVSCLSCRREVVRCNEATDEAMSLHAHSAHGCVGCCCRCMRFVEVDNHVRELCALEFHYSAGISWT